MRVPSPARLVGKAKNTWERLETSAFVADRAPPVVVLRLLL